MEKVIEVLMEEHRLIEQALGSLESYATGVRAGEAARREVIGQFAGFFGGFADTCHHGKEEDILFQRMVETGFPRDVGPLAVMLAEHAEGRAHVKALAGIAAAPGELAVPETQLLLTHADAYVPLLRQHILKEDHVLYPMALKLLTGRELDVMSTEFEAFELRMRADGSYDRLRTLADRLTTRYRPDPERMAAAAQMSHCGR